MKEGEFLGTGMKFPPQIDPGSGRFSLSSGSQSVRESIYLILMTNRGERWLQPGFGSQMVNYAFMDTSPTMMRLMSDDLREMLLEQEPRITDVDVDIDSQSREGCLLVNIQYTVAASNTRDNFVFPFYLNNLREEGQV